MASSLDNVDHARIVPARLPIEPMTRARTRRPVTFATFRAHRRGDGRSPRTAVDRLAWKGEAAAKGASQ